MSNSVGEKARESIFLRGLRAFLWAIYELRYSLFMLMLVAVAIFLYGVFDNKNVVDKYSAGAVNLPLLSDGKYIRLAGTVTGEGEYIESIYEYSDKLDEKQLSDYMNMLEQKFGAVVVDRVLPTPESEEYLSKFYIDGVDERTNVSLSYDGSIYTVDMLTELKGNDEPNIYVPHRQLTRKQALDTILTLSRAETGFRAEIGVYTIDEHEELADVNGWKYYVFDVVAEYSSRRREHRGRFYVSCDDGMVLRYNIDDGSTTLIRKGM